jgi:hypothetical protein
MGSSSPAQDLNALFDKIQATGAEVIQEADRSAVLGA